MYHIGCLQISYSPQSITQEKCLFFLCGLQKYSKLWIFFKLSTTHEILWLIFLWWCKLRKIRKTPKRIWKSGYHLQNLTYVIFFNKKFRRRYWKCCKTLVCMLSVNHSQESWYNVLYQYLRKTFYSNCWRYFDILPL